MRLVFLLLTPEEQDDTQIHVLQALANSLGAEENRDRLLQSPDATALWDNLEHVLTQNRRRA